MTCFLFFIHISRRNPYLDRNPQPIDVTMMANTINDLVRPNLPSRVKIREPDPFDSSCEGDAETRPLIYRDSLRQGRAEQM